MKVSGIQTQNNIYSLYFGRKKRVKKQRNEEKVARQKNEVNEEKTINQQSLKAFFAPFITKNKKTQGQITAEKASDKSFENSHAHFALDKYQKEAVDSYNSGNTTIVSAPTGTGKTLIAEYAIDKTLKEGKKLIYLSPLKALSNEKYTDFSKLFGEYNKKGELINTDNIGLITGDTTINPSAPILVMTTEIYRNSLLTSTEEEASKKYRDYDGVIYDEFHYLGDKNRGVVWEEAVMNTPKHMKQMMLSATASNADDIMKWVNKTNNEIPLHLVNVPESERYVPLREMAVLRKGRDDIQLEPTKAESINISKLAKKENLSDRQNQILDMIKSALNFEKDEDILRYMREIGGKRNVIKASALANKLIKSGLEEEFAQSASLILSDDKYTSYRENLSAPFAPDAKIGDVVKLLDNKKMTPALIYIFSKKGCNNNLVEIAQNGDSLLTQEESQKVYDEVQYARDKGVYLGTDFDENGIELQALMKGYAVHHAGKLPAYKSLIEKLARQGLVKACLATETLIAGINMPFKTTVFTSMDKTDGEKTDIIPVSTFKQGAGRAGRRGKDQIGNVIVMPKSMGDYYKYLDLTTDKDTSIYSKYQTSYASLLSDRMLNKIDESIDKTLYAHQNGTILTDGVKKEAKGKLEILKNFGFIEENEDGTLKRTKKGEIAKQAFGTNEIFLIELLMEPEYLKDFTKTELTALAAAYADEKDEDPSRKLDGDYKYLHNRMEKIFNLSDEVNRQERSVLGKQKGIVPSTNLVPYVLQFAQSGHSRDESLQCWSDAMSEMEKKGLLKHEGDFLRVVNGTIDFLKLISELSQNEEIKEEATRAIKDLRKAPVTDIFNYELNAKEQEEE